MFYNEKYYYAIWYNKSFGVVLRYILKKGMKPTDAIIKQSSKYPKQLRQYYCNEFTLSLLKKGML